LRNDKDFKNIKELNIYTRVLRTVHYRGKISI